MPVGAGIAIGTVGAGILSSRASGKASDAAAEGAERSSAQIQAAADRARTDVLDFFPAAQQDLLAGAGAAGGLLASGIGEQQRLLSAGNVGAQETFGQGFGQVQNALLGLPVNQQAFAPKPIELSQIPQNPLAQTIQQDPATQGDPQKFQPQNLFADVAQVQPKAQKKAFEGLQTNQQFISAISRGELDAQGIDLNWFNALAKESPKWNSSQSLLRATKISPEQLNRELLSGGLNAENQQKMKDLVGELQRLGGVSIAKDTQPKNKSGAQSRNRRNRRSR